MANAEGRIEKLEEKYSDLHTVVNVLAANVNNLTSELRDFKNEMRTQNLLRAKEFSELSKKQEKAQEKHDADIKEINSRIDEKFERILSQIQNMAIAVVVRVGAVVAAVVSIMK